MIVVFVCRLFVEMDSVNESAESDQPQSTGSFKKYKLFKRIEFDFLISISLQRNFVNPRHFKL